MIDTTPKRERPWFVEELAEYLGVKRSWLYDMTSRKRIPHRKIAGRLRFIPSEIDAWLNSQPGCSLKISEGLPRKG